MYPRKNVIWGVLPSGVKSFSCFLIDPHQQLEWRIDPSPAGYRLSCSGGTLTSHTSECHPGNHRQICKSCFWIKWLTRFNVFIYAGYKARDTLHLIKANTRTGRKKKKGPKHSRYQSVKGRADKGHDCSYTVLIQLKTVFSSSSYVTI